MINEDTGVATATKSDTLGLNFSLGDCVVCVCGEMKGLKGSFVADREGGRVLVQLAKGMYVELPKICLRVDDE